jgi:two-component sensor histidine kinase
VRDVTELRKRDRLLLSKDATIREIHHRVKNNLQIVISLLSLQASRLKDPAAREAVEQARVRVNALALVHRMIYEIDRGGLVELKPLFAEIIEQLHRGFGGERRNLALKLDVPSWNAEADLAIPLTLFAIEALTNVYKHGFPEPAAVGTISLKLEQAAPGRLRLRVEDDGRGLANPDDQEESTGARLMEALGRQVGGDVVTRPRDGGGTIVELTFPDKGVHGFGKVQRPHGIAAAAS